MLSISTATVGSNAFPRRLAEPNSGRALALHMPMLEVHRKACIMSHQVHNLLVRTSLTKGHAGPRHIATA